MLRNKNKGYQKKKSTHTIEISYNLCQNLIIISLKSPEQIIIMCDHVKATYLILCDFNYMKALKRNVKRRRRK